MKAKRVPVVTAVQATVSAVASRPAATAVSDSFSGPFHWMIR